MSAGLQREDKKSPEIVLAFPYQIENVDANLNMELLQDFSGMCFN